MNVYQAVRDAMGYVRLDWLVVSTTQFSSVLPLRRMIQPSSLERMSRSVESSGVPWYVMRRFSGTPYSFASL
jgi:hypothetical protein